MEIINILLITLVCFLILYFFSRWHHNTNEAVNYVPGPPAYPIIGSAYVFFNKKIEEYFNIILALGNKYGYPMRLILGNKRIIFINDVDHIKILLQNKQCLNKSALYKFVPIFGNGLVTVQAPDWYLLRKHLAPAFNTNMLQTFFNIFRKESLVLIEKLQEDEELNRKEIIYCDHIIECTLNIAYDTIGLPTVTKESKKIKQLVKVFLRMKNSIIIRILNILLHPNIIFRYSNTGRQQQKDMEFLNSVINKAIQNNSSAQNTTKSENKQKTVFDILIQLYQTKEINYQDIYDHIITMFGAASDTTATTLNFAIFLLANFPEIQEKAYEEIKQIYGVSSPKVAQIQYDDLSRMKYLERVIKETLRLFPSIIQFGRHLTEDLKLGKLIVSKDSEIFINIIHLHRDEKYWSNPLVFNPDRFLADNRAKSNYYSYIPFSSGLRNCIGSTYAMMSMKIILATLLRTFIFKVKENVTIDAIQIAGEFTIRPIKPLKVKFEKRIL